MTIRDASGPTKVRRQPYGSFRDDPRYEEIKRIIENWPPEKMDKLKNYIQRWLRTD